MNYWAYFNVNPKPEPANILILDDAHLAENAISSLYTISINRDDNEDLYFDILKKIKSIKSVRYVVVDDILNGLTVDCPLLLPFFDWCKVEPELKIMLDEEADNADSEIKYVWPHLRDHLQHLALYISGYEIQLRPVIYPTMDFRHFREPNQRIYLSATLGDPEDFQRRIGCTDLEVILPKKSQSGECGRRMIILFPTKDDDARKDSIHEGLSTLWPVARKRLWMCNSKKEIEKWKEFVPPLKDGTKTHIWEVKGSAEDQLDAFKNANLGHLFMANRYDGIDFPGDQCRLAIIPNPPITSDCQEEFFSAYLKDATFLKSRFSQRVAQALGRCNRLNADFAVYVFLSSSFERRFGGNDTDYLNNLPRDIQYEMRIAIENCDDGFVNCCTKAREFLSGKFSEWDKQIETQRKYYSAKRNIQISHSASNHEVKAWLDMWRGDPYKSAQHFTKAEQPYQGQKLSGPLAFIGYCHAWAQYLCYLTQDDLAALQKSIDLLEKSASTGPASWFTSTLRASARDLQGSLGTRKSEKSLQPDYRDAVFESWENILYEKGEKSPSLKKYLKRIEDTIISDHHDEVAEGITNLGRLAGFEVMRPKQSGAPDVVWRYSRGPKFIFTWEVKAELISNRKVCQDDIDQAHGQGRWAIDQYEKDGYTCIPLIVSCSGELEDGLSGRMGNVNCLTQTTMTDFVRCIIALFEEFKLSWNGNDSTTRIAARTKVHSKIPDSTWLYDAYKSTKQNFITSKSLLKDWNK